MNNQIDTDRDEAVDRGLPTILDLRDVRPAWLSDVGGKAAGLAGLMSAGFPVPEGFCVTTAAHRDGVLDLDALASALTALGDGPVAVRSSATTEDLPDASFAGQQDTVLNVRGLQAVATAIRRIWASLHTPRAVSYRQARGITADPAMAVVVQRMVQPRAAGVLFTVDPLTQTRGRAAIDAAEGLGTQVVDGVVGSDHYTIDANGTITGPSGGCLRIAEVRELARIGRHVEETFGRPQDIEWAIDHDGTLWLLQSRAITSLFPLVENPGGEPRAFMEVGHMQGMHGPATPMGQAVLDQALQDWLEPFGFTDVRPGAWLTYVAHRMYVDLTAYLCSSTTRSHLDASLDVYGPRVTRAVLSLLDDPRFNPTQSLPLRPRTLARLLVRVLAPMLARCVVALADPRAARERAFAAAQTLRQCSVVPDDLDASTRLRLASRLQRPLMYAVSEQLGALYGALLAREVATGLLAGIATRDEVDQTQRGMPYNVTVDMDLALWEVAQRARGHGHAALLTDTPPEELARRYRAGALPDIGLAEFLRRYGHRGAAEIDVGVPRWHEDPTAVFAALAGYVQVTDPEAAPDQRYARAMAQAERSLSRLGERAIRQRPLRGRVAMFLLHRNRELGGLRELPKFSWLYPLDQVRTQLLRTGEQLVERGLLDRPDDIMMLFWPEAEQAAAGADLRALVAERRRAHDRERRRVHVPALLLSDGTDVEATLPALVDEGVLAGLAAAPGVARGRVRVVHDPRTATVLPGEILVARTTDPGWTPLFLTAAALVTETGSPMAHGPTVAREYGIPAVICLADATTRLTTGAYIEVDGSAGTVRPLDVSDGDGSEAQLRTS